MPIRRTRKRRFHAGPNNPVGVVWVDISKEHFGLHGTPEPLDDRSHRISRLRQAHELGRGEAGTSGERGDQSHDSMTLRHRRRSRSRGSHRSVGCALLHSAHLVGGCENPRVGEAGPLCADVLRKTGRSVCAENRSGRYRAVEPALTAGQTADRSDDFANTDDLDVGCGQTSVRDR